MKYHHFLSLLFVSGLILFSSSGRAETVICMPITSLPAQITSQGVYCLTSKRGTSITTGVAIEILTNNVVLDLNGFALGGLGGGAGTQAVGISGTNVKNVTIKNGASI